MLQMSKYKLCTCIYDITMYNLNFKPLNKENTEITDFYL